MADVIECSICIDFYSERENDYFVLTQCGHFFHKFCIDPIFRRGDQSCPYCRKPIDEKRMTRANGIQPKKCVNKFKITVIGDIGVGKTCLARRYVEGVFSPNVKPTIGSDFWIKQVQVGDENVSLHIWDTSGQEKCRESITPQYIRGSQGVIIVYDTKHGNSLLNAKMWYDFANQYASKSVKILIGAREDLETCSCSERTLNCVLLTDHQKDEIAQSLGLYRFETSAKTNHNVEIAFRTIWLERFYRTDIYFVKQDLPIRQELSRMKMSLTQSPNRGTNDVADKCQLDSVRYLNV